MKRVTIRVPATTANLGPGFDAFGCALSLYTDVTALPGLYPAGEGAGYAGGIMSAAVDGMEAAEAVLKAMM